MKKKNNNECLNHCCKRSVRPVNDLRMRKRFVLDFFLFYEGLWLNGGKLSECYLKRKKEGKIYVYTYLEKF